MSSDFTPQELEKLAVFREKVSEILETEEQKDNYFLIRWLRARGLDLSKAEEMLRKSLKWRQDGDVDGADLREEIPLKFKRINPMGRGGVDSEGNLVLIFPLGRYNHRVVIDEIGLQGFIRQNIVWVEKIMREVREHEKKLNKRGLRLVQIVDMEGYSFKELTYKPGLDYILQTQKIFDENYPEMLRSVIIINAPRVFSVLFNLVKPLVSKETQAKMSVYGPNEDDWKKVIKQRFDLTKFPPRWGGTKAGSDPFCSQDVEVWPDGPLPLAFFSKVIASADEGFIKVKVSAREKLKLDAHVTAKNSKIVWKFWTENNDIGFEVVGPDTNDKVVRWSRTDAQNEMKEGELKTEDRLGTYRLVFDNSYSYTKAKTLYYLINVVVPE